MASEKPSKIRVEAREESPVVHSLEVAVDVSLVQRAFERTYRELARSARVKGFRPGKAPRSVLEKLYGPSVAEQVERGLVAETLADAVEQAGLEPVTEPAIDAKTPSPDGEFRYTARLEVKPQVTLPDTKGLPAQKPRVDVSNEDVDRELEGLQQRQSVLLEEPEGAPLAEGHVASIDFVGRIDGRPFEGGSGQGVDLVVGSGRFLPGFEEQLLGAQAGEDREVRIQFPEDYQSADVAGKEAVFAVHVVDIKRRSVPELDDEFAKDLGEFADLAALRDRIRDDLAAAGMRESNAALRRSLVDALIERTPFEVPPGLVARELERQLSLAARRLEGSLPQDALRAQMERWREEWRERAERDVREALILEAVARDGEIRAEEPEVEAKLEEMAREQGADAKALSRAYGDDNLRAAIGAQLVEEKALDFLIREAKVEETTDT